MINGSMKKMSRAAKKDINIEVINNKKREDLYNKDTKLENKYVIDWHTWFLKCATPELEEEEYLEARGIFQKIGSYLKKNKIPKGATFDTDKFSSKVVPMDKVSCWYEKGFERAEDSNMAQTLLEQGIITDIRKVSDEEFEKELGGVPEQVQEPVAA